MNKYLDKLALFRSNAGSSVGNKPARSVSLSPVYHDDKLQTSIDRYGSGNPILKRIKCHPLVDLFPDELIVREKSVTIVRNSLLSTTYESMAILDIGRVQLNNAAFFATLRCIGLNPAHEMFLKGLRKKDALEVEGLIESLMLSSKYNSSVSKSQNFAQTDDVDDTTKSSS